MSREALRFIHCIATDTELRNALRALGTEDLREVTRLGNSRGFEFDAEDLQTAFVNDWKMRRRFYSGFEEPTGQEPG